MLSNSKKSRKKVTKVEVNHKMKDYENEPFFVQNAEASKKVIEKYGIPKSLTTGEK
jgi:hypothetical protein